MQNFQGRFRFWPRHIEGAESCTGELATFPCPVLGSFVLPKTAQAGSGSGEGAMDIDISAKMGKVLKVGTRKTISTVWFLLKVMLPTSFAVALLGWSGLLEQFAGLLSPLMRILGLPGEAALVFISGVFLNNYSAIAAMGSMGLSLRDATILAIMCLIAHNLIVETAVMKSAGSSAAKMVALRIGTAIVAAIALNLMLPAALGDIPFSSGAATARLAFPAMLAAWGISTLRLVTRLCLFVFAIMLIQSLLDEFKVIDLLSKIFAPFMKLFGLPAEASFLWIIINVVGYTYGAGIIKSEYEAGTMKKQDGDLFNHHAAISHSLLEDSFLYAGVGIGIVWIMLPRLVLSIIVVWLERIRRNFFKKTFRVGTV